MLLNAYNTPNVKTFLAPGRIWAGEGLCEKLPAVLPAGPRLVVADAVFDRRPEIAMWSPATTILTSGEPCADKVEREIAALPNLSFACVIALGGGSAIDVAKAVHAHVSFGALDIRDKLRPFNAPVLVAVPTTAGSGSETSRFFILSEKDGKRARRSWSVVPDLTILDPRWLAGMHARGLVLGAFDAFCHLWETFVCRNERSPYTDMLALTGIPKIASALAKLNADQTLSAADILDLQFASALGGQAISNVRTGLIHTLSESLSPLAPLSHPQTLWVFYAKARASYREHVADRIAQMDLALGGPGGLHRLDRIWAQAFSRTGLETNIREGLTDAAPDLDALMTNVMRDAVLLKENPAPVDWSAVRTIAADALGAWREAA